MHVRIFPTSAEAGRHAAEAGAAIIRQAIDQHDGARVIFSTGNSQRDMLSVLTADASIDWRKVSCFHLDEYIGIDRQHPASFCRYLKERLVDRLPSAPRAFHYVDGMAQPAAECRRQQELLRELPIDVAFIGIGENGHLAFNDPPADFKTTAAYHVVTLDAACRQQQVGEGWFATLADVPRTAISMTVPEMLKAQSIICFAPDERKAAAVQGAVEGPVTPNLPASMLQRSEATTLYLDAAAASRLGPQWRSSSHA